MNENFILCDKRNEILSTNEHLLIEGGPGCGKTTIALLKGKKLIEQGLLQRNQKVLFLSFARATISRVEEQAKNLITQHQKKQIEINTYHGFCWALIQAYGYLLSPHRKLSLISPPNLLAKIAHVPEKERDVYKNNLVLDHGIICFDLFAQVASDILEKASRICTVISGAYPFIIVDEFQDTDTNEWRLIQILGKKSKIIALADFNQRIYEFRGASITRIPEFINAFRPKRFDFGLENNRSATTDIVQFGDDILIGQTAGKQYKNVVITRYPYYHELRQNLKYAVVRTINRLRAANQKGEWSLAILVKSKQETLSISSFLTKNKIFHDVLIDPAGPALAAVAIANLLESMGNSAEYFRSFISCVINHVRGRKGERIPKKDLELADALDKYLATDKLSGKSRQLLLSEINDLVKKRNEITLTGSPEADWRTITSLLEQCKHETLHNIFDDAQYVRLLNKGAILSKKLSEAWKQYGNYMSATKAVNEALTQEYFSMAERKWTGVFVMNIHKCKGKEFDEVIIWEEPYKQIVSSDSPPNRIQQDRILLRVAVTRARTTATFLTPASKPCILL
jgi:DNA helicase II / ATP-dependent DNA helicase PcrA